MKKLRFYLHVVFGLHYLCIHEGWWHLNKERKKLRFYLHVVFGLHYLCIHEGWWHLNKERKKLRFYFHVAFGLHYLRPSTLCTLNTVHRNYN